MMMVIMTKFLVSIALPAFLSSILGTADLGACYVASAPNSGYVYRPDADAWLRVHMVPATCRRRAIIDPNYKWEPRTGSCYKLHRVEDTWVGALATCHKEGGHLAIINSETESIVLKEMFATVEQTKPSHHRHLYIGFAKYGSNFATIYGQTLAEAGFDRWCDNEPNNYNGKESCGSIHPTGLLNDAVCDKEPSPFICEITP